MVVTGARGQVGQALTAAKPSGIEMTGAARADVDLCDQAAVLAFVERHRPDVVINAAAYTAVDAAESDADTAFAVNRDGVANLARACDATGAAMIHLSTDYVFTGDGSGELDEDAATGPRSVYGESKLAGEEALRETLARHVIVRLSWVFGEHGNNFAKTIVRLAREREELRVVDDQHGCPTYTGHIAGALIAISRQLADNPAWGTFHYRGDPPTTWFGFAGAVLESARRHFDDVVARELVPVSTDAFPTPATRPANSVLGCARLQEHYGIELQPWLAGVDPVVASA